MMRSPRRLALADRSAALEAPTALPYAFSGAKIAVAVAVIGAVFAELANPNSGLGYLINQDGYQFDAARQFAAMVVLCRDGDRPLRPVRPRGAPGCHLAIESRT